MHQCLVKHAVGSKLFDEQDWVAFKSEPSSVEVNTQFKFILELPLK